MKLIQLIPALALLLAATTAHAQEKDKKDKTSIVIDGNGISINKSDSGKTEVKKEEKVFSIDVAMIDIGVNGIQDNTDYTSPAAKAFLNMPNGMKTDNLFSLQNAKSINVNVYPIMARLRLLKTGGQKIYLSTGIGLQMYNFRFTKNISYLNNTQPELFLDSTLFTKNKLGLTYLSVPLQATFKTKIVEKAWLVYGFGITGGYRIASWTKQVSGPFGKVKNHDKFNFADFNSCLTAEIGLDDYFRLYASYQLTALHENALDQHPFCIGIRLGGM